MQPTDVNENKELPPSSDFLSPLSTGKPVGHGRKHNSDRNERGRGKKKQVDTEAFRRRWLQDGGGCEEKENGRQERIPRRLFRRVAARRARRDYTRDRRNYVVTAKRIVCKSRNVPFRAAPRRDATVCGGCISVIRELE